MCRMPFRELIHASLKQRTNKNSAKFKSAAALKTQPRYDQLLIEDVLQNPNWLSTDYALLWRAVDTSFTAAAESGYPSSTCCQQPSDWVDSSATTTTIISAT